MHHSIPTCSCRPTLTFAILLTLTLLCLKILLSFPDTKADSPININMATTFLVSCTGLLNRLSSDVHIHVVAYGPLLRIYCYFYGSVTGGLILEDLWEFTHASSSTQLAIR